MKSYTIEKADCHLITYHEVNSSDHRIVITFATHGGGLSAKGFGTDLCIRNGWNTVYIGKALKTRFRSLPGEHLSRVLKPYVSGRETITYGASAGGYAALYYGGFLKARILAGSPRNSQHPIHQKNPEEFYHIVNLYDAPLSPHQPTIIYDRGERRDHRTVVEWILPAYPDAQIINVVNAGHFALERLRDAGVLSRLVRTFVDGGSLSNFNYTFPVGTVDYEVDEARRAHEAGDHTRAVRLFLPHTAVLEKFHAWEAFAKSIIATSDIVAARFFLQSMDAQGERWITNKTARQLRSMV